MSENRNHIHVVGLTSDGQVWHTIRRPSGWSAWTNVFTAVGRSWYPNVTDVAAARLLNVPGTSYTEGLVVVLSRLDEQLPVLFREPISAAWGLWDVLSGNGALRVTAAFSARYDLGGGPASQRLHLAYVTPAGAAFGLQVPVLGTPEISYALPQAGRLRSISLAFGRGTLATPDHPLALGAVRADGRAWIADGAPSVAIGTVDVESAGAGEIGDIVELVRTSAPGVDQLVAVTGDGRIWLAGRQSDGAWRPWRDLELTRVAYTAGGVLIVTEGMADVGTFRRAAATTSNEGLHIIGLTTDGRLWHQLRPDPWAIFRDIELVGVGDDVGDFVAVAAA